MSSQWYCVIRNNIRVQYEYWNIIIKVLRNVFRISFLRLELNITLVSKTAAGDLHVVVTMHNIVVPKYVCSQKSKRVETKVLELKSTVNND